LRFLDRLQPLALLVLRVVLGVIMIGHGYPKVFGGLSEHVHHVSNIGLPGWLAGWLIVLRRRSSLVGFCFSSDYSLALRRLPFLSI
jgi:uncharacterized membrane protein YphA (DoxX/SURF4 family)